MKEKGITYIIISLIIMMMILVVFLINLNVSYKPNKSKDLIKNYENELEFLIQQGIDEQDLNNLNKYFKQYIKSNNYNGNICVIYFDGNNCLVSDYQEASQETVYMEADAIDIGNCKFDKNLNKRLNYYIEVYNKDEKSILSK